MARNFVVGIDCDCYYVPPGSRYVDPATPETANIPRNIVARGEALADVATNYQVVTPTRDVTLNLTAVTSDATNRGSNGWRQVISAIKEGSVDMNVLWLPDDPAFTALLDSYLRQCPICFMFLDGPITGWGEEGHATLPETRCGEAGFVTGLHADFVVTSFSRGEALEDVLTADVTLESGLGMIYPEWIKEDYSTPAAAP